ncbi:MAG TPA: hypothetical protein VJN89_04995 [Candidatus Acidoferrum sp.]|nr:hypothetical protein [Candidatus Acidoferrum sp.]
MSTIHADQQPATTAKRRSRRFPFQSIVEATWQEANGKLFREEAKATEVNAHGGLLEMKNYPAVGIQIELTNLVTRESAYARIIGARRSPEGRLIGVAVELTVPSETFWGSNFQLKKICADLVRVEYEMRSGPVDERVLREFRDAVDHVRKTAWAVQEWQQRQSQHADPQSVIPLVVAERLRRATQICDSITADVAAHQVNRGTVGAEEFLQSLQRLGESLRALF